MKRKTLKNNHGVVGIVVAVLLIGLIVAVVSLIQNVYVPKWMEEKESEHMSVVANQFSQLKYSIDTHSVNQRENTPISTSFTLGSKEMPYLMSVRAFGQLEIFDNSGSLNITYKNSDANPFQNDPSFGIIKYSSFNGYFIDQTYIYEYGAVVLSQFDGNAIIVKPSISVKYEEDITINITIVNISSIGGKKAISGYGTYPIQTEYLSQGDKLNILDISSFTIKTDYTNVWSSFFNAMFKNSGIDSKYYSIDTYENNVIVTFNDKVKVNVDINIINIGAQIAPGWVENT